MTRSQLRPFYTAAERAALYAEPYRTVGWEDHRYRTEHTSAVLRAMKPASVADLSCGDGAVVLGASLSCPVVLGDIAHGWPVTGPVEETILACPKVDVFVCSETLEHIEDPEKLLGQIRARALRLLLTTPEGELSDVNPEHYWGWEHTDVADMLAGAGWRAGPAEFYTPPVSHPYYRYQIWRCE